MNLRGVAVNVDVFVGFSREGGKEFLDFGVGSEYMGFGCLYFFFFINSSEERDEEGNSCLVFEGLCSCVSCVVFE